MFEVPGWISIGLASLEELYRVNHKYLEAPIIMGNTMTGITYAYILKSLLSLWCIVKTRNVYIL